MDPISPNELALECPFAEKLGVDLQLVSVDEIQATMPVQGNQQPFGMLHGGASAGLCEHLASTAALLYARERFGIEAKAAGTELSISHLRPARGGHVTAICRPLFLGSSSAVHQVEVRDADQKLCATARVTNVIMQKGRSEKH